MEKSGHLKRKSTFPQEDLAFRRVMTRFLYDDSLLDQKVVPQHSRRRFPFRSCVTTYLFAAMRSGHFSELF
jgi:3-methyladenine DNA glycosylase/8-oxoguanine DNA glycosylase